MTLCFRLIEVNLSTVYLSYKYKTKLFLYKVFFPENFINSHGI